MTPTEEHDDITRRLENAKDKIDKMMNTWSLSDTLLVVLCLVYFFSSFAFFLAFPQSGAVTVLLAFAYFMAVLCLWFLLSRRFDPNFNQDLAAREQHRIIQKELREFEKTHAVVWGRGKNPEEKREHPGEKV